FSSRRRHTRSYGDWSSDVCSSDLGLILTTNHLSRFDPPLVFLALPHRKGLAFAADIYRHTPFFSWVLESVGVIWVSRGTVSPKKIGRASCREGVGVKSFAVTLSHI